MTTGTNDHAAITEARGIGRRVQPGKLDVFALVASGALTTEAVDGSATCQLVVRQGQVINGQFVRRRPIIAPAQPFVWPARPVRP